MKRLAFAYVLILTALPIKAQADDPPKPVVPAVVITGPVTPLPLGANAFLDASGSTTDYPIVWKVSPVSTIVPMDFDGRKRIYALIPNLIPGTTYLVTVTAVGKAPNGDPLATSDTFTFSTQATAPTPTPPGPPTPGPATTDLLGMTAATRDIVQPLTWTDTSLTWRQTTLANAFMAQATLAPNYPTPQAMVTATAAALKAACGQVYPDWQSMLLGPLEAKVNTLRVGGQIKTVADLAEAFTEIAAALKEAPIARR